MCVVGEVIKAERMKILLKPMEFRIIVLSSINNRISVGFLTTLLFVICLFLLF